MFDTTQPIPVRVPSPAGKDGFKRATVRWPSDEEWARRLARQQTVIRGLGRGETETETLNGEAVDAELFGAIRVDSDGEPFDTWEAAAVVAHLAKSRVVSIERSGVGYTVVLRVARDEVRHVVRMPSQRQISEYRRASCRPIDQRHNITTLRLALGPSIELYDNLVEAAEGYSGPVPAIHKAAVLAEIRADLDAMMEEPDPE